MTFANLPGVHRSLFIWLFAAVTAVMTAACGGASDYSYYEEMHAENGQHDHQGHHVHTPLFGGQLVEIGDHFANIEFLFDAETGTVTVYTLDAHADGVQRVAHPHLDLVIFPEGADEADAHHVQLPAIADPLSGETVGDSSKFETTAPDLIGLERFRAMIWQLTIRGGEFEQIEFEYPSSHH